MERTYVMIKPDGVQRSLIAEVISFFERKGLKIVGLKMLQIPRELAEEHYEEHKDKPFFYDLVSYITSGPVVAMVLEGKNSIAVARELMGATNPQKAAPGTIRGSFGMDIGRNVVHGSDSPDSANREIGLFFNKAELVDYKLQNEVWIYE